MNADQLQRKLDDLELALLREDPTFCRRWTASERSSALQALAVFSLLAAGAVLLATGLAIQSLPTWCAGAAALVVSFGVDCGYQRALGGPPPRGTGRSRIVTTISARRRVRRPARTQASARPPSGRPATPGSSRPPPR
jgi:hypothetical protein